MKDFELAGGGDWYRRTQIDICQENCNQSMSQIQSDAVRPAFFDDGELLASIRSNPRATLFVRA